MKEIQQELTYNELDKTINNLWSVLFTTGYLTQRERVDSRKYRLAILQSGGSQSPDRWLREIFPFTEMHKNIKMNQFILSVQYCIAPFLVLRRVKTI